MNELTVINYKGQKTIDSRDVAEMVNMRHSDLLEKIKGYIQILQNGKFRSVDFFIESTYRDSTGRTLPCYLITKMGCDMIANKLTGEKGVLFTAAYVNKFHEMDAASEFALPQNYGEALRELATTWEAKQLAEAKVKELQPKADFFDAVADSKTAIDMAVAAKVLAIKGIGRNKLFETLREKKVLAPNNQPYQEFVDRGYFRVVEQKYTKPDGSTNINIKTLVYQKGLEHIRRMLTH